MSLRYAGPDVVDGTMALSDVIPVLQGFAGAYSKIAAAEDPESSHRIRIVAVRPGSADIVLEVWRWLGDNVDPITSATMIGSTACGGAGAAIYIVKKILGTIAAKRHVQKKPFSEQISSTTANQITIINAENVTLDVPLDVYELFKSGNIDADLSKMVSPLAEGKIELAEFQVRSDNETVSEEVKAADRPYFDTEEISVASTREAWLTAKLNSFTKSTKSGFLYLTDGSRVFYKYIPDDGKLLRVFQRDEPINIRCIAHMDESLRPHLIEIYEVESRQFYFAAPEEE